jgi:adenylosuccinate lyase
MENLVHEHERDGRSWKTEWGLIGPTCAMTGSLLRLAKTMCANLQVDEAAMLANLEAARGYVLSEGVMLALAQKIGKQNAHEIVYTTAMRAFEADLPLKEAVLHNEQITAHLSAKEIERLFDYRRQLGLCPEAVNRVVALAAGYRARDETEFGL